jgi:hypothetical protein
LNNPAQDWHKIAGSKPMAAPRACGTPEKRSSVIGKPRRDDTEKAANEWRSKYWEQPAQR